MAYTIQRIGKSLIKFFKPIRVAPPHLPEEHRSASPTSVLNKDDQEKARHTFKLLKFKKPDTAKKGTAESEKVRPDEDGVIDLSPATLPDKGNAQWLDLVVFLLNACKRASLKMKKRMGLETYRATMVARGKSKFQTRGSIVNTTATDVDLDAEKKPA